jgi:hypothetical protein
MNEKDNRRCSHHTDSNGALIYEGDHLKCEFKESTSNWGTNGGPTKFVDGFTVDVVLFTNEKGWHISSDHGTHEPLHQFACVSEVVAGIEAGKYIEATHEDDRMPFSHIWGMRFIKHYAHND